jgi:hypothetical protein
MLYLIELMRFLHAKRYPLCLKTLQTAGNAAGPPSRQEPGRQTAGNGRRDHPWKRVTVLTFASTASSRRSSNRHGKRSHWTMPPAVRRGTQYGSSNSPFCDWFAFIILSLEELHDASQRHISGREILSAHRLSSNQRFPFLPKI